MTDTTKIIASKVDSVVSSKRRRSARGQKRERKVITAPAYVKRQIPFYEFLGEEGLVKLEEQADWLILDGYQFDSRYRKLLDLNTSKLAMFDDGHLLDAGIKDEHLCL